MGTFFDDASLAFLASGAAGKDGKAYSIKPTDGTGDFTFSRGSNLSATRVNASQLIEKGRENLLLQSNQFDTTWTNVNTTETSGQSGYDGSNDAWLLSKSAASARIEQSVSQSGVLTFSVFAKAGTLNWIRLNVDTAWAFYDLANGVVGSDINNIIDHNIYDIGGGWYRCELVINLTASVCRIYPAQNDGDVGGTSGNIVIQDSQLESSLIATDVIETTTTTGKAGILEDTPRFDYLGASCPSLLLEPSRTNFVPFSEYIGSAWNPFGNTSVNANDSTSPEGVINATKISATATATSNVGIQDGFSVSAGTEYTVSFFAKKTDFRYIQLFHGGAQVSSNARTNFDIQEGLVAYEESGVVSASIEDYGNGWYRCIATMEALLSTLQTYIIAASTATASRGAAISATAGDSYQIFGIQVEAGSYATSYIPTMGVSQTRAKDISSVAGASAVIGSTEGTIFLEVAALANDLSERRFALSNGTTGNVVRVGFTNVSNRILAVLYNGANQCVLTYNGVDITSKNKIAFAYNTNDFTLFVNGQERATDTSGSTFSANTLTDVHFNEGDGNGNESFGKFDEVILFKTRLSDTDLATLTT